jgi:hypothetical protein
MFHEKPEILCRSGFSRDYGGGFDTAEFAAEAAPTGGVISFRQIHETSGLGKLITHAVIASEARRSRKGSAAPCGYCAKTARRASVWWRAPCGYSGFLRAKA